MSDEVAENTQTAPPTGDVNKNSKQVLANAFQNGPLDSKKWIAMMIGLGCVMFIFLTDSILIGASTQEKAQHFISLANMAITFIGAMTTALITGQSAVEWRVSDSLSQMHNTEVKAAVDTQNINIKKDVHIDVPYTKDMDQKIKEDNDEGAAEVKPFSAPAQGGN